MANKNSTHDEKLIQELYEKLWWYTHEASEEEFNEKEVDAIVQLLDVLEPIREDKVFEPGVDAAFERFQQRFGLEEEFGSSAGENRGENEGEASEETGAADTDSGADSATDRERMVSGSDSDNTEEVTGKVIHRKGKRKKPDWKKIGIRVGIGVAACLVLMISLEVGTYALRKQSFFEVIRQGDGKTEVFVTGNMDDVTVKTSNYETWDAIEQEIGYSVENPINIPKNYSLVELSLQESSMFKLVQARYISDRKFMNIDVYIYPGNYERGVVQVQEEWVLIDESDVKLIYQNLDEYIIYMFSENMLYYIHTNELIENIILS